MDYVLSWISQYGYAGLFALLMLGIAGLPIPDETLLMFSGYLISQDRLQPAWTFFACLGGSVCGISLSYGIGRLLGHTVIEKYGSYLRIKPGHIEHVHEWYRRSGELLLVFGYFIPGVRHFSALVAGMSKLEYRIFAPFAYAGAIIWVLTFLTIGYLVGDHWELAMELVHRYTLLATGIAVLLILGMWWMRWQFSKARPKRLS